MAIGPSDPSDPDRQYWGLCANDAESGRCMISRTVVGTFNAGRGFQWMMDHVSLSGTDPHDDGPGGDPLKNNYVAGK